MSAPTRDQRGAMVGRHAVAEPYVGLNYDTPSRAECPGGCDGSWPQGCPACYPALYARLGSTHRDVTQVTPQ